jgi:hypothetical protein
MHQLGDADGFAWPNRTRLGLHGRGDSEEAWAGRWRRAQRACATQRYDWEGGTRAGQRCPALRLDVLWRVPSRQSLRPLAVLDYY